MAVVAQIDDFENYSQMLNFCFNVVPVIYCRDIRYLDVAKLSFLQSKPDET